MSPDGSRSEEEAVTVATQAATAFVNELMLSNSTREFGVYFRKEWLSKAAQWVAAFRSGATITTNNFLESWHRKLKGGMWIPYWHQQDR